MGTGRGWGTAPKNEELPYFVVGVLFAPAGCHEARFAETVSREVRTPVRVAGRKTSTDIPAARPA